MFPEEELAAMAGLRAPLVERKAGGTTTPAFLCLERHRMIFGRPGVKTEAHHVGVCVENLRRPYSTPLRAKSRIAGTPAMEL